MNTEKKLLVLRTALVHRSFFNAARALEFARKYHKGMRKDGITPEFDHQLSIALYALTLPNLINPEAVIAAILLHDVSEDYSVSPVELRGIFTDKAFANEVAHSVDCVTKKFRGIVRDEDALFEMMAEDPHASIVKPADRMHNLQTMVGVFSIEKQVGYIDFAEKRVLPMVKKARKNFPEQAMAYENMKHVILSQISLIRAMHAAVKP